MSLIYNSRILADARITNVNGMRGLGVSILRLNVEFRKTPWKADETQIGANVLWGALSLRTDSGIARELGRVHPDLPVHLAPSPDGGVVHHTFSIGLSDAQLFAIEELRKGGNVDLRLNLVASGFSSQYGQQAVTDDIPCKVNISDWARILNEFGHGDVIVLGVHLPIGEEAVPLRSAIEFLHQANRHLSNGEYDAVVARCRLAIESVQKILGDEAGGCGDESAADEADGILVRLGGLQGGEVGLDAHRRNSAQRLKAVMNQTGISPMVGFHVGGR